MDFLWDVIKYWSPKARNLIATWHAQIPGHIIQSSTLPTTDREPFIDRQKNLMEAPPNQNI